ncbi:MAG: hypothetical protein IJK89_06825 [Clostridia bacterium]|nr:hypothetical protein [Clostridia bacterium]
MKCPKCGGEIPFYDLKPNCKHCGVNIMYYSQHAGLEEDAKRTELEGGAARMVIARVKAAFIGSKLAIARLVITLGAVAVLMLPFGSVVFKAPFYEQTFSAGLIGVVKGFTDGVLTQLPNFLHGALFGEYMSAFLLPLGVLALLLLVGIAILCIYLLSFLNLTPTTKAIKNLSLVGAVIALLGQIVVIVYAFANPLPSTPAASFSFGWGGFATAAVWFGMFIINRIMLKKGIEPTYKENDIKRRDLLKKVRAGEVSLDSLPLPVFESEEEREERMRALEEALKAEEEGKEL